MSESIKQRYKLTIEYDGTLYVGFQKQRNFLKNGVVAKSVESVLEEAIFNLAQERVKIVVSGRTDAGVHALGQVLHFDLRRKFKSYQIVRGLNNYLREEDVVVLRCELVDENFHACFGSEMRHYRYVLINRDTPLALDRKRAWHVGVGKSLNVSMMRQASECLIGRHDFSSFRDAECQSSSPVRTVKKIEIRHPVIEFLLK